MIGIGVVELREEERPVGEHRVRVAAVAPAEPLDLPAQACPVRRGRLHPVVRRVQERGGVEPARGDDHRGPVPEITPAGERERRRRSVRGHAVPPGAPGGGERHPERPPSRPAEHERDRHPARPLDEVGHPVPTTGLTQMLEEEPPESVGDVAARVARRRKTPSIEGEETAVYRGRIHQHPLVGAGHATAPRDLALEVRGEPLDHPAGIVQIREEHGRPAEHALGHAPPSTRPIQVEDMRELVREDEREGIIVVAERRHVEWRVHVDDDPVGRRLEREPVRVVDVVGDDDVDRSTRRVEPRGEPDVCGLGGRCGAAGSDLERRGEVHREMRRAKRAPGRVGHHLAERGARAGERDEAQERNGDATEPVHGSPTSDRK